MCDPMPMLSSETTQTSQAPLTYAAITDVANQNQRLYQDRRNMFRN